MGFQCGIIGLPNVGKSTLFSALTAQKVASENFPFCTIDPNVGVVEVPDPRMERIAACIKSEKQLPATIQFVDIAGLVKGASQGEGLGNQFLGHIRSTDAVAHVVRCFDSEDITHVDGSIDPVRDIETINVELVLADTETVTNNLTRLRKASKASGSKLAGTMAMLEALMAHLQKMEPARSFEFDEEMQADEDVMRAFRELHLITAKPMMYVCNVSEDDYADSRGEACAFVGQVRQYAANEGAEIVVACGQLEGELAALDEGERAEFLADYGIEESSLAQVIRGGYKILGLQTYFTAGPKEIRAWTIKVGDTAPRAAGKIHTDFERGFICAEVYRIDDLEKHGSKPALKAEGLLQIQGRDYVVSDGDVMEFRFNV